MPERFAAVDIGSNSCLLLIVEKISPAEARVLLDTKRSTRVSAEVAKRGVIGDSAAESLFKALSELQQFIQEHRVDTVTAVGTQVFRQASNGAQIAEAIRDRFGWRLEIISGKDEARLSYLAAATGLGDIFEKRVVADVGGGSTEVITGRGSAIDFVHSYPVGAVNLTEKFQLDQRVSSTRLAEVDAYLTELFLRGEVPLPQPEGGFIVVGGTITTLGAAFHKLTEFAPAIVHGTKLSSLWIEEIAARFAESAVEQRRELIPFDPKRAEIILAGTLIVRRLLNWSTQNTLIVSNRGLRWGLLLDKFAALRQLEIKQ